MCGFNINTNQVPFWLCELIGQLGVWLSEKRKKKFTSRMIRAVCAGKEEVSDFQLCPRDNFPGPLRRFSSTFSHSRAHSQNPFHGFFKEMGNRNIVLCFLYLFPCHHHSDSSFQVIDLFVLFSLNYHHGARIYYTFWCNGTQ